MPKSMTIEKSVFDFWQYVIFRNHINVLKGEIQNSAGLLKNLKVKQYEEREI